MVLLDGGPLGLVVHPRPSRRFGDWAAALAAGPLEIGVPEVVHYELRRELLRLGKSQSLSRLAAFVAETGFFRTHSGVFTRAAELWAEARRLGRPTADSKALDIDMLLCATVQLLRESGIDAVIATTNVRHLKPFVPAYEWQTLDPRSGAVTS